MVQKLEKKVEENFEEFEMIKLSPNILYFNNYSQ